MYENGWGVEKDLVKAADQYKAAANAGLPEAMVNIGTMYENGHGVDQNLQDAQFYYAKAARAGNDAGATNIANMYVKGLTTDLPESEIMDYLAKSSDRGDVLASSKLGELLLKNQDYEQAAKYYLRAADKADPKSLYDLAKLYQSGKANPTDPTLVQQFLKKAADQSYLPALADYGLLLAKTSPKDSIPYLEKAAKQGRKDCIEELAFIYLDGNGVDKNVNKGIELLSESAKNKDFNATRLLGNIYYDGEYVPQDLKKALKYYSVAAKGGDASAQNIFGEMLLKGEGIDRDVRGAIAYFETAADQNNIDALKNLGEIYYTNQYGLINKPLSYKYFDKARELGDSEANIIILQRDFRVDN